MHHNPQSFHPSLHQHMQATMGNAPSSYPPPLTGRFHELLEALRAEYEGIHAEWAMYKHQRDDMDQKLQGQLGDIGVLQRALADLERSHLRMKQSKSVGITISNYYFTRIEDEIERLKGALELVTGGSKDNANGSALTMIKFPTVPNLDVESVSLSNSNGGAPPPFAFNLLAEGNNAPPANTISMMSSSMKR